MVDNSTENMEPFHSETMVHAQNILKGLDDFRKMDHLTDVTVCVRETHFKCHKLVLATSSPYFNAMFQSGLQESIENRVCIRNFDEKTVQTVIEYIYSGTVAISWDNVWKVLEAGNFLQVEALKARCVQFLTQNLEPSNCIGIWHLAEKLYCTDLASGAKQMILSEFSKTCLHEEFLSLDSCELVDILKNDDLNTPNEEVVCDAVLRWLQKDDARKICLDDVLEFVRLPFTSPEYLLHTFEISIPKSSDRCSVLMEEAKRYHMLPARRQLVDTVRTKPRNSFHVEETVVFSCTKSLKDSKPGSKPTSELKCFHLQTKEWTTLPRVPFHQNIKFGMCSHGNNLYISGGSGLTIKYSTDLCRFNGATLEWSPRAHMNQGRIQHVMAAVGHSLYVIGGFSAGKVLDSIEEYSIALNKWTHVGRLDVGVCLAATAVCGHNIYIMGGYISNKVTTDIIQCYDTRTKTVTSVGKLPLKCALHCSVVCEQGIYIVNRDGNLIKFTPGENPVVVAHLDNFNRDYFGAIGYRGSILLFGGQMEKSVQLDIQEYNLSTQKWSVRPESIPHSLPINYCVRMLMRKTSPIVYTKF